MAGYMTVPFKEGSLPSNDKSHELELVALRRNGHAPDIFSGRLSLTLGVSRGRLSTDFDDQEYDTAQQSGQEQSVTDDDTDPQESRWKHHMRKLMLKFKKQPTRDTSHQTDEASEAAVVHDVWEDNVHDRVQNLMNRSSADSSESSRKIQSGARGHFCTHLLRVSNKNQDIPSSGRRMPPQRKLRHSPELSDDNLASHRWGSTSLIKFGRGLGRLNDACRLYVRHVFGHSEELTTSSKSEEAASTSLESEAETTILSERGCVGDSTQRDDQNMPSKLVKSKQLLLQMKKDYNLFKAFNRTRTVGQHHVSYSPRSTEARSLQEYPDIINAKSVLRKEKQFESSNSTVGHFGLEVHRPGPLPTLGFDSANRILLSGGDLPGVSEKSIDQLVLGNVLVPGMSLRGLRMPAVHTAVSDDESLLYNLFVKCANRFAVCASPLMAMARGGTTEATAQLHITWPLELMKVQLAPGVSGQPLSEDARHSRRQVQQLGNQITMVPDAKEAAGIFVLVPGFLMRPDYFLRILNEEPPHKPTLC